ncbi:ABC transporter ATP-binding protein [Streptomyces griseolus]|uniref:ABC transporter ATP-binding protein n=2 Tax=Streptomyces TaxID=1883 RepID=UPI0004BE112E|nr:MULTISPECIES: ABC transporter ATP-binding protein [Streptomyces]MYQ53964.1 ATP-binding cassette domain-containing protein [Streptomyces sp. SID4941]MYR71540.1 ATP-binding cassette domain-containing protein [Streptomyces sp. SID4925]MCW8218605.1 ABC transporter ATP-binding protein [Streptomyces griseolus]SBV01026.1 amino acid/amide ABC transporter ATP-binding protein 1, HAAT family [Streptomyces sp. OspMP-M45]SCE15727.1 amino acid/amide ABC transporter ATP-binding protein 1, HAAT family [Str
MTTMTATAAPTTVLDASGVTMRFGGLTAVRSVDLTVDAGEIVGLIGPNGAGKTTFFNCLTGLYVPTEGTVRYKGTVLPPKPHLVTQAGIARTFQNIRLFANMTVLENVLVGRHTRTKEGLWSALLRLPGYHKAENASRERAMELLEFIGLADKAEHLARNLPYGDQRKLEIARALASDPGLLLLDEPTAGMNPQETRVTEELIFAIRDQGIAVLVIEHDMRFIFNLCDRVACLVQGEKLVEGTASVVQSDERVIAAYLGTPFEGAPGADEVAEVEAAEADAAAAAPADRTPAGPAAPAQPEPAAPAEPAEPEPGPAQPAPAQAAPAEPASADPAPPEAGTPRTGTPRTEEEEEEDNR